MAGRLEESPFASRARAISSLSNHSRSSARRGDDRGIIECRDEAAQSCIIVGIDHSSDFRPLDYLPFPPGTGRDGIRPEMEKFPGGGIEAYAQRVVEVLIPFCVERYG
eukprot:949021-Pyramimonas_sp.AAC.1